MFEIQSPVFERHTQDVTVYLCGVVLNGQKIGACPHQCVVLPLNSPSLLNYTKQAAILSCDMHTAVIKAKL